MRGNPLDRFGAGCYEFSQWNILSLFGGGDRMTAEQIPAIVTDEGGQLNQVYYKNMILDIIERALQDRGIDTKDITANRIMFAFSAVREAIFNTPLNNPSMHNTNPAFYTEENIQALFNIYLQVAEFYNVFPSLYAFYRLTGIEEDTVTQYLTSAQLDMLKSRREWIRNKLGDSTLGVTVLANNDSSVGLMYTAQNQIRQESIKQGLTVESLPKLGKA